MHHVDRRNLEIILVRWLEPLRRGDVDSMAESLGPGVVWQGVRDDLFCGDRDAVLDVLRDQVGEVAVIEAVELIAVDDRVVLGVRSPDLQEIGGVEFGGQTFIVFTLREGLITRMEDHLTRAGALEAAGAADLTDWR